MIKEKIVEVTEKQKVYIASDGEEFSYRYAAECHDKKIYYNNLIKDVPVMEEAYYCKTQEDFDNVIEYEAYLAASYSWTNKQLEPSYHYDKKAFAGEDWYFFHHEENENYADDYYIETMSQKLAEHEEWLAMFEKAKGNING